MGSKYVTVVHSDLAQEGIPYEQQFLIGHRLHRFGWLAPRDKLLAAGIKPWKNVVYELANGESVQHEVGFTRFKLLGDETVGEVIFGPQGVEPSMGTRALDSFGLVVDPVTKNLVRLRPKPLKHLDSVAGA